MYCRNCGIQLHDGARFCDECGVRQRKPNELTRRIIQLADALTSSNLLQCRDTRPSITYRQLALLKLIDGTRTSGDLAAGMGVSPAVVTGLVDRLEGSGLVQRQHLAADRRVIVVELTERGMLVRDQCAQEVTDELVEAFSHLSIDEGHRLQEGLDVLIRLMARVGDD